MECKDLTENGLIHEEKTYTVNVKALICDAPARAYLKRIKNHNAYHSCERCITKGAYITKRVAFNEQGCTLLTDEAVSAVAYKNHQTGVSPFIAAGLSCVISCLRLYAYGQLGSGLTDANILDSRPHTLPLICKARNITKAKQTVRKDA